MTEVRSFANGDLLVPVGWEQDGVLADVRLIVRAGTVEHAGWMRSLRRDGVKPRVMSAREEEMARSDEAVLSEPPSAAPGARVVSERRLIAALRYRADEVQLGRALHAVAQDPDVARSLADALLAAAREGRRGQVAAKLGRPPAGVVCAEQEDLFASAGRLGVRRRVERLGAVDLTFTEPAGTWRLLVELKIDSAFGRDRKGREQLERYQQTQEPLLAVVRDATTVRDPDPAGPGWLGAITWAHVLPDLYDLPVTPATLQQQWHALLDVTADRGDFTPGRRGQSAEAKANAEILEAIRDDLLHELQDRLRDHYKRDGRLLADGLHATKVGTGDRRAWFQVRRRRPGMPDARLFGVELEQSLSRSPVISVWWFGPPAPGRGKRRSDASHQRLQRDGHVKPVDKRRYRSTRSVAADDVDVRGAQAAARRAIAADLALLVDADVFWADIKEAMRDARS
jgi:hypothetical protein